MNCPRLATAASVSSFGVRNFAPVDRGSTLSKLPPPFWRPHTQDGSALQHFIFISAVIIPRCWNIVSKIKLKLKLEHHAGIVYVSRTIQYQRNATLCASTLLASSADSTKLHRGHHPAILRPPTPQTRPRRPPTVPYRSAAPSAAPLHELQKRLLLLVLGRHHGRHQGWRRARIHQT